MVKEPSLSNSLHWSPVSVLGGAFGRPPVVPSWEPVWACRVGKSPAPGGRRRCGSPVGKTEQKPREGVKALSLSPGPLQQPGGRGDLWENVAGRQQEDSRKSGCELSAGAEQTKGCFSSLSLFPRCVHSD